MKWYVMKANSAYTSGYEKIATVRTENEAKWLARERDTKLNGEPLGLTRVWTEAQYTEWHEAAIMPYYKHNSR